MLACKMFGIMFDCIKMSLPHLLQGSESEGRRGHHRPRSRDVTSVTSL